MTARPQVWQVIQRWMDGQVIRINQSQFAEALGVSRQTVSQWKSGEVRPSPQSMRLIASVTRIPFASLTSALLIDMGYTETEDDSDGASIGRAGESPAINPDDPKWADPGLPEDYDVAADVDRDPPKPFEDHR